MKPILFSVLAVACCVARAQPAGGMPSASAVEAARQRVEAQRKELFEGAGAPTTGGVRRALPSGEALEQELRKVEEQRREVFRADNPTTVNPQNSFPNVATPARSQIDIEAVARRYEQKAGARRADGVMVFASFSMPKESLKRLIGQANKVGAAVVMRGFRNGSIKDTALAVNELGEANGNLQVNPNAFVKYKVDAVPAVVLMRAESAELVDGDGCALPEHYAKVTGDVSLGYALGEIEKRSPAFREMAVRYGRTLKGDR